MKKTFNSLFGLKGSPSPEKEDPPNVIFTTSTEAITEQAGQHDTDLNETQSEQPNGNRMIDSRPARTDTADVSGAGAIEAAVHQVPGSQQESVLSIDPGPQEVRDVTVNATQLPDEIIQDIQKEKAPLEAASPAREHSPELINLQSSSDAEDGDDNMEEAEADRPTPQPSISASTPQKRSKAKGPETDLPDVVGSGHAEIIAISPPKYVSETTEPDTALPDAD
jgi:hypothetical protein